jgi:glucose/arabinose dehydrogenase
MRVRTAVALGLVASSFLLFNCIAGAFVTTELVASGLNMPVYVTAPQGDGRLFILEQRGVIKIVKDGTLLAQPFLDITALVKDPTAYSEQGLLGLAFDPDFTTNRFFYVHYTDNSGNTMIERYEVDSGNPDIADAGSGTTVLTQTQPYANHNGGTIGFGPDGYLYFGFGDGGSGGDPGNRAQDPTTLLGKMIRIDVTPLPYTIPPDNPYAGSGTVQNEIWARGVRNPYRWSFDRDTGDLWIADVGQSAWEEIDFQPAGDPGGENYGWRLMEGFHCYNPPTDCGADTLDLPIHEYGHVEGNCSITGGSVYRGAAIPELQGYYIFGDYCSNRIWALRYDGATVTDFLELTDLLNPGGIISGLSDVGQDGHGELYLVDRAGTTDGEVYRIIADPSGVDPEGEETGELRLGPPTPNPFSSRTKFELTMGAAEPVSVQVFDASGRLVRTVIRGPLPPGSHYVYWDGRDDGGGSLSSGVYFARAASRGHTVTEKVNLVR